jgi:hypothetical protein
MSTRLISFHVMFEKRQAYIRAPATTIQFSYLIGPTIAAVAVLVVHD